MVLEVALDRGADALVDELRKLEKGGATIDQVLVAGDRWVAIYTPKVKPARAAAAKKVETR